MSYSFEVLIILVHNLLKYSNSMIISTALTDYKRFYGLSFRRWLSIQ